MPRILILTAYSGSAENNFTTSRISANRHIGGLTAFAGMRYSVALNPNINVVQTDNGRFWNWGRVGLGGATNRASTSMTINGKPFAEPPDGIHGIDVAPEEYHTEYFWRETLGWDFEEVWVWNSETNLPTLRGLNELPAHRPGDVNGDGKVDAEDVRLLRRYLTGLGGVDNPAAADLDGNGLVSIVDLTGLRLYLG